MLLAIDVGNSETKLGFFAAAGGHAREPAHTWQITTARRRTADEFGALCAGLLERAGVALQAVRAIVVSSVVPQTDRMLAEAARKYFGSEAMFFSAATQHLMEVSTERPKELGSDLLLGAVAARKMYGTPLIVVGYGTATTFSAVSREGEFLGAALAPGIQVAFDALIEQAAKLPQVALEAPNGPIGRDTVSALQAGIVFGAVGQTEALVSRMRGAIGEDARVVATGGLADIVARETAVIEAVEPHLVLLGLRAFYDAREPAA
jgi:type III pantothenate kinase